ncbi:hypothetical protein GE107_02470 [Cohnella sp. CFH 77786]|uniref:hypothetical protein n=1 Tax=Cohnella sp. CFH 77786 TaxID=2662265 RepID=UPI001C60EA80|nr:hypothetical protein [Cohnella sp. CFH 77786]MBW5444929.1 hypothetical protein [Cohnella sp. CFH 77786]
MNRYLKLVVMELHRFWKIYAALMLLTFLSQFGGLFLTLRSYLTEVKGRMYAESLYDYAAYAEKHGPESFYTMTSRMEPWFTAPVLLCIAALLFYVFMIWYRDWFGKNPFVYRMLMLPTSRMNLYWAKLTAIMVFVLGLVGWQLVLFPLHMALYRSMLPAELAVTQSVESFIHHHSVFQTLIPQTFTEFVLYYGAGLMTVTVLFTSVLIERSYRFKGIAGGLVYAAASLFAMLAPQLVNDGIGFELYPWETFLLLVVIGAVLLALSLGISRYLLIRKITV